MSRLVSAFDMVSSPITESPSLGSRVVLTQLIRPSGWFSQRNLCASFSESSRLYTFSFYTTRHVLRRYPPLCFVSPVLSLSLEESPFLALANRSFCKSLILSSGNHFSTSSCNRGFPPSGRCFVHRSDSAQNFC